MNFIDILSVPGVFILKLNSSGVTWLEEKNEILSKALSTILEWSMYWLVIYLKNH